MSMVLRIISSASKAPPETKMFSYERLPSTTSALEKKHNLIKQEILIHKRVTATSEKKKHKIKTCEKGKETYQLEC